MGTNKFYGDHKNGRNPWYIWIGGFFLVYTVSTLLPHYVSANLYQAYGFNLWLNKIARALGDTQISLALIDNLLLGIPFIIAIGFVQRIIRQRPISKLINGLNIRFRWKRFLAGILVFLLILALGYLIFYILIDLLEPPTIAEQVGLDNKDDPYSPWNYHRGQFGGNLTMVIFTLPLLAIYVLAQELTFRGFVDQGLSRYIKTPILICLLSGLIYALAQSSPGVIWAYFEYGNLKFFYVYMLNLILFGFFLSFLTYMDNGLEAALGIHLANIVIYEVIPAPFEIYMDLSQYSDLSLAMIDLVDTIIFYALALTVLAYWRFGLDTEKPTDG